MKILVTGSNGLLGQKLSMLLQKKSDVELIATARGKHALTLTRGQFETMDICNPSEVMDVFQKVKPDAVIHGAAMTLVDKCETDREQCWKSNVTAVENIIKACASVNAHLVHVSTDFIFDGSHGPLDEEAVPSPVNFYGESKLAAEKVIMESAIDWCIARTVLVYGVTSDMSRSNIVLWVKENLEQEKTIQVVNDQWRTPTLAEDLAMGCFLAAYKKAKGIYNIAGKDFITPYDIAIKTAEFFGLDNRFITIANSSTFKQVARRPLITGLTIDKARRDLGYEPHSFEQGIAVIAHQSSRVAVS